jgi:hypothetical protein
MWRSTSSRPDWLAKQHRRRFVATASSGPVVEVVWRRATGIRVRCLARATRCRRSCACRPGCNQGQQMRRSRNRGCTKVRCECHQFRCLDSRRPSSSAVACRNSDIALPWSSPLQKSMAQFCTREAYASRLLVSQLLGTQRQQTHGAQAAHFAGTQLQ